MFNQRTFNTARIRQASVILALILATSAHATSTLVGGGSTTVSFGYVGGNAATELQISGTGIGSTSLLGVYSAQSGSESTSYCQSSDVAGKDILAGGTIGVVSYSVQNACTRNAQGIVTGFGAAAVGRTDLAQSDFVAAESPLNTVDMSDYQTEHGSTAWPTQFPALAASIAMAFNLKDNTGNQVTSSEVNFTTNQLCDIFSGTVTSWNDTKLVSAFTLPAGRSIPYSPINVLYRLDPSGETFTLSNYLALNCGSASLSHTFESSQTFAGMDVNFLSMLPTNWAGSYGDQALATAIDDTANSIGYVGTPDALAASLQMADVNGKSPTTNFGAALTVTASNLVSNEVVGPTNAPTGAAQFIAIQSPPATKCIYGVPVTQYLEAGARGSMVPSTSYPIVALSYLLSNAQSNNATDLTALRNLVDAPYDSTITGHVTTIGVGTGLALLSLGANTFSATAPGVCLN